MPDPAHLYPHLEIISVDLVTRSELTGVLQHFGFLLFRFLPLNTPTCADRLGSLPKSNPRHWKPDSLASLRAGVPRFIGRPHKTEYIMNTNTIHQQLPINAILQGNCIDIMDSLPKSSVDFILTDPPYLVNYRDRGGRTIQNDIKSDWLKPAMASASRMLKDNSLMLCFYGWSKADQFFAAWKLAGLQPVGHVVFRKTYSSASRFLRYQHEQAYLLAKGRPALPKQPIADVLDMPYSGNALHPTQKPVVALAQVIRSLTSPGELVLDPFAGSGSSCAAAMLTGRRYIGVEMDDIYYANASARLERIKARISQKRSLLLSPHHIDVRASRFASSLAHVLCGKDRPLTHLGSHLRSEFFNVRGFQQSPAHLSE